jgi:hypothetical protein
MNTNAESFDSQQTARDFIDIYEFPQQVTMGYQVEMSMLNGHDSTKTFTTSMKKRKSICSVSKNKHQYCVQNRGIVLELSF